MRFRRVPRKPDRWTWATYAFAAVVCLALTADPSAPRWMAVTLALTLGVAIGAEIQAAAIRGANKEEMGNG